MEPSHWFHNKRILLERCFLSQDLIVQIFREFLKTAIFLMGPILIATIIVGLLVSIFQAATQIHEMTLVFVPKIIVIGLCLMILFPWMLNLMVSYTVNLFSNIPTYVK
ncbi:MAG TPA: flagellar biosynthesis protein FliQ [Syntrophorhabdus sp.]|nr:flagellar biosynthesis protein FliQ [Syntrophorhabdus sp.]MDI9558537.1 flagellar biosynthesis protein FliQ [Pseudomonadota bacterium]MBP8743709.1 flagellar biosynthesis protein FliQ [Syntrophorhabdus sp.]HNY69593.1 flagellar biosynthesis protein FliQ [Syntrophorhabdus sp.]HPW35793.1 flagellar biosynthesis protein FliQ [Syntrophorhabdus sp.]